MRRMLALGLLFLLPCLVFGQAKDKKGNTKPGGSQDAKEAVAKLDDELFGAAAKGGEVTAAVFEKNLGDDYVRVNADGSLMNKSETLNMYKSGQLKIDSIQRKDRKIRVYSNTAIVTREDSLKAHSGSNDISGAYRQTVVYVKGNDGQWKDVYFQTTKIPAK